MKVLFRIMENIDKLGNYRRTRKNFTIDEW